MTKAEFENWIERLLRNKYPDGYRANPLIKHIEPQRKKVTKQIQHHGRILTIEQVRAIRIDPRRPFRLIAKDYKVSESLIGRIKSGRTWRNA